MTVKELRERLTEFSDDDLIVVPDYSASNCAPPDGTYTITDVTFHHRGYGAGLVELK